MSCCQVFQFVFQVAGDLSHARDFAVHPVFVEAMRVWFLGKNRNAGNEVLGGNNDARCRGRTAFSQAVCAIGVSSP